MSKRERGATIFVGKGTTDEFSNQFLIATLKQHAEQGTFDYSQCPTQGTVKSLMLLYRSCSGGSVLSVTETHFPNDAQWQLSPSYGVKGSPHEGELWLYVLRITVPDEIDLDEMSSLNYATIEAAAITDTDRNQVIIGHNRDIPLQLLLKTQSQETRNPTAGMLIAA